MWTITRHKSNRDKPDIIGAGVTKQGTPTSNIIEAKFSIFRGPNYIKFWTSQPYEDVILNSEIEDDFVFQILSGKRNPTIFMHIKLVNIKWDFDKGFHCMLFKPQLIYQFEKLGVHRYPDVKTIQEFVDAIDLKNDNFKIETFVSPAIADDEVFNGVYYTGNIMNFLAEYCITNNVEFYVDDFSISVGIVQFKQDTKTVPEAFLTQNTHSSFTTAGITFSVVTSDTAPRRPGRLMMVQDKIKRIVSVTYNWDKNKDAQVTCVCTEPEVLISEEHLAYILDMEDSRDLKRKLEYSYNMNIGLAKCKEVNADGSKEMWYGTSSMKPEKSTYFEEYSNQLRVYPTSPYAGNGYGLQFPDNPSGVSVTVAKENQHSTNFEVGQVFETDDEPARASRDDFRLTFPKGDTIYYDKSASNLIIAVVGDILLGSLKNVNQTGNGLVATTVEQLSKRLHKHLYKHTHPGIGAPPTKAKTDGERDSHTENVYAQ